MKTSSSIIDFKNDKKCNGAQRHVFVPHNSLMECESKLFTELEAWENEIYDTLNACCRDKFPNYITSCCESDGAGGCALAGTVNWLPDWANGHCYEKDTNLIEDWEWRWAHDTLESCCGRCKYGKWAYFGLPLNHIHARFLLYFLQTLPHLEDVIGGG